MAALQKLLTAEEFSKLTDSSTRQELVRGSIVEMPLNGWLHGQIVIVIGGILHTFVTRHRLGRIAVGDTGFVLESNPDTVRGADVAFLSNDRLARMADLRRYGELAPDLVVEVVSPSDRPGDVRVKVEEWRKAGARLIWVVYPEPRTIMVHVPDGSMRTLTAGAEIEGGDVLPGFHCPIDDFFA